MVTWRSHQALRSPCSRHWKTSKKPGSAPSAGVTIQLARRSLHCVGTSSTRDASTDGSRTRAGVLRAPTAAALSGTRLLNLRTGSRCSTHGRGARCLLAVMVFSTSRSCQMMRTQQRQTCGRPLGRLTSRRMVGTPGGSSSSSSGLPTSRKTPSWRPLLRTTRPWPLGRSLSRRRRPLPKVQRLPWCLPLSALTMWRPTWSFLPCDRCPCGFGGCLAPGEARHVAQGAAQHAGAGSQTSSPPGQQGFGPGGGASHRPLLSQIQTATTLCPRPAGLSGGGAPRLLFGFPCSTWRPSFPPPQFCPRPLASALSPRPRRSADRRRPRQRPGAADYEA